VVARYVKLVIEEPLYTDYKQIVEFQVQTKDRNGAIPADQNVEEIAVLPTVFDIAQNYPNPFNAETTIQYQLPIDVHVNIQIFDVLGRLVTTLVDEPKTAGFYKLNWRAENSMASGIYFYRIKAGDYKAIRRFLMIK
jgi:hypothetical protein